MKKITLYHFTLNGGLSSFSAGIEVKIVIYLNSRNEFIRTSFRGYRLLLFTLALNFTSHLQNNILVTKEKLIQYFCPGNIKQR